MVQENSSYWDTYCTENSPQMHDNLLFTVAKPNKQKDLRVLRWWNIPGGLNYSSKYYHSLEDLETNKVS